MDNEKYLVPDDGHEDEVLQTAEEKATAEKARHRELYICARLSAVQHSKAIRDIESGIRESIPGTVNDIVWLRHALACALKNIEELEGEFADDPRIKQDMMETDRFLTDLVMSLGQEKGVDK